MQELICISAFLYQYIEFFMFLKVARRGGYNPPTPPPKSATGQLMKNLIASYIQIISPLRLLYSKDGRYSYVCMLLCKKLSQKTNDRKLETA